LWDLVDPTYVPIDWACDFISGYRWPSDAWFMNCKYGHQLGVDPKVPWELARMQHLPTLVWAYTLARAGAAGFRPADEYVREFRNEVLDFQASNPPRFGINWRCTMDVGIRIANWLTTYDLFLAQGATFDASFEAALCRSAVEHGRYIVGHLEWGP